MEKKQCIRTGICKKKRGVDKSFFEGDYYIVPCVHVGLSGIPFILDVPSIIRKEYRLSSGFVKNWDYSHEDRVKARSIMFIDEVDKEEKSITVLAEGIYEGEYIKVQYLPHLRLGIVLERGKDD